MSDRPNTPVPDELAAVREQIRQLEAREGELRRLLLAHPDLRDGASYVAEIRITKQMRTDWRELRACHPDIVEEFTFPTEVERVELLRLTEDGELVSVRKKAT